MATYGQGAPGTRIRLRDNSAVNIVNNPRITAGIVGFSSKGELNKIINITSTAAQDVILGNGYNDPKFNQGMYAARGVLSSGGFTDFVRPFGETVITDDTDPTYDLNQALKSDAFLVSYTYEEATDSFGINHYSATRYVTDGFSAYGSRKVNTIAETIVKNTNIDFSMNAGEAVAGTIPLFAIMNTDPTSATRAGDRIAIKSIVGNGTVVTVTTKAPHKLVTNDDVYVTGTSSFNTLSDTVNITVTTPTTFTYPEVTSIPLENVGAIFVNSDTIGNGVDYVQVKTVARGIASKHFDAVVIADAPADNSTIKVLGADGIEKTVEFTIDGTLTTPSNIPVQYTEHTFTQPVIGLVATEFPIVNASTFFAVGDVVKIAKKVIDGGAGTLTTQKCIVASVDASKVTLVTSTATPVASTVGEVVGTIYNLTQIAKDVRTAVGFTSQTIRTTAKVETVGTLGTVVHVTDASIFSASDKVMFTNTFSVSTGSSTGLSATGIDTDVVYTVSSVDLNNKVIYLSGVSISDDSVNTFEVINLTSTPASTGHIDTGVLFDATGMTIDATTIGARLNLIANFEISVTRAQQIEYNPDNGFSGGSIIGGSTASPSYTLPVFIVKFAKTSLALVEDYIIAETDDGIMLDSDTGITFVQLGLATEDYVDVNFDGVDNKVYKLTTEGEAVAKVYLFVNYFYNGDIYSFSGTIIPYVYRDSNLFIGNSAESVESGFKFIVNESLELGAVAVSPAFDLSLSVKNSILESVNDLVAFDPTDPAIINDAIWAYDPKNNNSTSTMVNAWNLFLDKDTSNADMLVASGTAISDLFVRNFESLNMNVMTAMLSICESRKDMFAIFDGIDESDIKKALKKMVGIGSNADLSRWGAIYDGRSIFFDSTYTKLNVEGVKSIEVASMITANRSSNVYWLPPAGYETGRIPGMFAKKQKFIRTYRNADDPNSDIALLYDANINPTRVNEQGQFIYGQKTMLRRSTALNRLNVIMLVAGMHKRFANFLDFKVFQLNTGALRNSIQAELQAQIELIKSANPAGLTAGVVICDESNNTQTIIDTNQLIVDVLIQPTRTTEFITLRTTVQRTGDALTLTNTIIGG